MPLVLNHVLEHSFGTNFSAFCDKHSCPRPLQTKHVSTQSNSEPDEESGSDRIMEPSQPGSPDAAAKHEAELSFVAGRTLSLVADAAFKGSSSRGLSTKQAMKNAVTAVAKVAFETELYRPSLLLHRQLKLVTRLSR